MDELIKWLIAPLRFLAWVFVDFWLYIKMDEFYYRHTKLFYLILLILVLAILYYVIYIMT